MKQPDKKYTVTKSKEFDEEAFGISTEDQVHILEILRDKLYSDKTLAVVREYLANAVDANKLGPDPTKPVKVKLPTSLSPTLVIRDFGPGLTHEEVKNIYTKYGASTKRSTNDQIGQLGLGCKAAFAYVKSFTVTSFNDGKKTIYNAYLDESGKGAMALITSLDSKEPSGIEVSVPINPSDISQIASKAYRLAYYIDSKIDITPSLDAFKYNPEILDTFKITNDIRVDIHNTPINPNGSAIVVMGGIPYPVDSSHFEKGIYHQSTSCIYVPIGAVEIAPSREALQYTKKTIHYLSSIEKKISDVMGRELTAEIDNAKDYPDAIRIYSKIRSNPLVASGFVKLSNMNTEWNGIPITGQLGSSPCSGSYLTYSTNLTKAEEKRIRKIGYDKYLNLKNTDPLFHTLRYKPSLWQTYIYGGGYVYTRDFTSTTRLTNYSNSLRGLELTDKIYVIDVPMDEVQKRVSTLCPASSQYGAYVKNKTTINLVKFGDDQDFIEKFYDMANWKTVKLVKLSTVPIDTTYTPPARNSYSRSSRGSDPNTKKRHSKKYFKFNGKVSHPYSLCWDPVELDDTEENLYVLIDKFKIDDTTGFFMTPSAMNRYLERLVDLGVVKDKKDIPAIYGIKVSAKKNVPSNWINFFTWLEERSAALFNNIDIKTIDRYVFHNEINRSTSYYGITSTSEIDIALSILKKLSVNIPADIKDTNLASTVQGIVDLASPLKTSEKKDMDLITNLMNHRTTVARTKIEDRKKNLRNRLIAIQSKLSLAYPLIPLLDKNTSMDRILLSKEFIEYLKLKDEAEERKNQNDNS